MGVTRYLHRWTGLALSSAAFLGVQGMSGQSIDSSVTTPAALSVSGFVDTYFAFNFARPASHVNQLRNFDVTENQFVLSMAEVSVQKFPSPVGFRIDMDLGQGNDIVQSGATGSLANLRQAYVTVVAPLGTGLTVDAGKFVTHCCYEVIPAKDNFNYSRSLLFAWSVPYYHLGVRANYRASEEITLNGYVYNGWNGLTMNNGKTFGFEAVYAPARALSIVLNWLGGPALPDSVSRSYRNIYELIVTFTASEQLTLAANGVYGEDHPRSATALWRGVAGYLRYMVNDVSSLAVRAEAFADPAGFMTSTPQNLYEATLTYEHRPFANLILRGEYRFDWSSASAFDGHAGTLTRKNQSTIAIGAIVVY